LQASSWTWRNSRSTMLPWQRSCRIISRQDLKRGMKTFCQQWETVPGGFTNASCIWVLRQGTNSMLLCINLNSFPMVPSTYKKNTKAWTGFNWPLQCCLQQIWIF
jgi:hypothetical protein